MQPARAKVLLVDDQALIGEAVRRMVATDPSIAFRFCSAGSKAIDAAHEFAPTVILQDLVMPDADGLALLEPALRLRLQLVQQCRPADIEAVRARYAALAGATA